MHLPEPQRLLDLSGETALVTGAGTGIGAGIARRLGQAGANVAVHFRNSEAGAATVAREIEGYGRRALPVKADVTDADAVKALVSDVEAQLGPVSILVNNAGIYPLAPLEEMTAEQWDEMMNANLRSVFLCTQQVAARMKSRLADGAPGVRPGGSIVNIASIEGLQPAWRHSHYNAAKGGVITYTKASALELAPIRVNAVSPGLIARDGIEEAWPDGVARWKAAAPLERLGTPEDIGDAVLFLASPAARWITGANLVVDGGVTSRPLF
ncbi:MAG: glucose 1-dehydrogenase [Spirochaetes bacterium]|jgi:NAD(P)-dependent dehydrogenase (short-subunit alcohol dehydrogenase family)|nr:glucose 1-dehydrogenase [Spirochaetota bacterium]